MLQQKDTACILSTSQAARNGPQRKTKELKKMKTPMSTYSTAAAAAPSAGCDAVTFAEILAAIGAKQAAKLVALNATLSPCPQVPALVEEVSELVVKKTGFGGKWVRRKYADGTLSHAAFMGKGVAEPRYSNEPEVYAAREKQREWVIGKNTAIANLNFISGHARGLLNGTDSRSGGYRDFGPRTLATLRHKAQGNSQTAVYCQEIVIAYDAAMIGGAK